MQFLALLKMNFIKYLIKYNHEEKNLFDINCH